MQATFKKDISFPKHMGKDSRHVIDFEVSFSRGGFSYEFWGQKGFHDTGVEIDEITFDKQGLTKSQAAFVQAKIENDELNEDAYQAMDNQGEHHHEPDPPDREPIEAAYPEDTE